ncbi:hypothetical protein [Comamonas thiooxydans]|uniref:hypothetical protein n=1 Tax=Comamonas thiooxydans TaxID=363952 RepID=UPI0006219DB5|nr:hypothetical protein [Comamonas thiooxydans]KKI15179.1 hypothetical protein XA67_05060 [Comamonas thiooxydans]
MRFAMHKEGDTSICLVLEVPEQLVKEVTPEGVIAIPVGPEVTNSTHIILEGKAVPISGE